MELGLNEKKKKIKDIQLSLNSPKYLQLVFCHFHTDFYPHLNDYEGQEKKVSNFLSTNHRTRYIGCLK